MQDVAAFAEECAFHPGLILAAARALATSGGNIQAAVVSCLEDDVDQYMQHTQRSISLQAAGSTECWRL